MKRRIKKFAIYALICPLVILAIGFVSFAPSSEAATNPKYYKYFGQAPTAQEKKLMKKHPAQALKVYKLSKKATKITIENYGMNGRADNSDAFRHCLWSALIKKAYGKKTAKKWVTAHEGDEKSLETKMDMYNNRVGYSLSVKKLSEKKLIKKVKAKVVDGKCRRLNDKQTKLIKTNGDGLLR